MTLPLPSYQSQDIEQLFLRMLVWGPPGAGKTYFVSSAQEVPAMQPVLFLNIDRGTMSIRKKQGITIVDIPSTPQADGWVEFKQMVNYLLMTEHPYNTIIIDSLDGLHKLIQDTIIKEDAVKHVGRDMDLASINDWYRGMNRFVKVMDLLKRGNFNLLCTCAQQMKVSEQTGLRFLKLDLPANLADTIPGVFDVVGHLRGELVGDKITRYLQTADTPTITAAKDRGLINKPVMQDALLPQVWRAIREEVVAEPTPSKK